jgi:prevent-host-death family protein
MKRIGAYEAKTNLGRLLDEVAEGESVEITKHGRTVALLVPPEAGARELPVDRAIAELRAFRRGRRLGGVTLRSLIDDGRRR